MATTSSSHSSPIPQMMPDLVSWSARRSLARRSSRRARGYRPPGRQRRYNRSTVSRLWFRISGPASTTMRSASSEPLKSGIRSSTEVSGRRRRISSTHAAKLSAPPFGRSSRSTLVITTCCSSMAATASARRRGSSGSYGAGVPWATAQYAQFRVQTSPRIMNVAVRWSQHSPMLGQCASSQTVLSLSSRIICRMPA